MGRNLVVLAGAPDLKLEDVVEENGAVVVSATSFDELAGAPAAPPMEREAPPFFL